MNRVRSLFMSLFCTFLISIAGFASLSIVSAQPNGSSVGAVLSSSGVINYTPTPTPTPTPTTNIAVMPAWATNPWRGIGGDFDDPVKSLWYPVNYAGKTNCFKISPSADCIAYYKLYGGHGLNEVNMGWNNGWSLTQVKPGDHVIWRAWVWLEANPGQSGGGLCLGADAYDASGRRICELVPHDGLGYPWPQGTRIWAPWGSTQWVELWMEWDIPATYISDGQWGVGLPTGTPAEPAFLIPFFVFECFNAGWDSTTASAYVWNMEFYINP